MVTSNVVLGLALIVLGSVDLISRKIALEAVQSYPFFLSQFSSVMYLSLYSLIYYCRARRRRRRGREEGEGRRVLEISWLQYAAIGFADAFGSLLGNIGASRIIGYQVSILAKLNIPISAAISFVFLKKTFAKVQVVGMVLVILGGVFGLLPSILNRNSSSNSFSAVHIIVYIVSVFCTAFSFALRERLFMLAKEQDSELDIFKVLSYSNAFTFLFTILLLPIAAIPKLGLDIPFYDIFNYFARGFKCFSGECYGSPWAPIAYISVNLFYNVCVQTIIKKGGTVTMFVIGAITFPLSSLGFLINWPLLPAAAFSIWIIAALITDIIGIFLFQAKLLQKFLPKRIFSRDQASIGNKICTVTICDPAAVPREDSEYTISEFETPKSQSDKLPLLKKTFDFNPQ